MAEQVLVSTDTTGRRSGFRAQFVTLEKYALLTVP